MTFRATGRGIGRVSRTYPNFRDVVDGTEIIFAASVGNRIPAESSQRRCGTIMEATQYQSIFRLATLYFVNIRSRAAHGWSHDRDPAETVERR
jgi:hypothetical protein